MKLHGALTNLIYRATVHNPQSWQLSNSSKPSKPSKPSPTMPCDAITPTKSQCWSRNATVVCQTHSSTSSTNAMPTMCFDVPPCDTGTSEASMTFNWKPSKPLSIDGVWLFCPTSTSVLLSAPLAVSPGKRMLRVSRTWIS